MRLTFLFSYIFLYILGLLSLWLYMLLYFNDVYRFTSSFARLFKALNTYNYTVRLWYTLVFVLSGIPPLSLFFFKAKFPYLFFFLPSHIYTRFSFRTFLFKHAILCLYTKV